MPHPDVYRRNTVVKTTSQKPTQAVNFLILIPVHNVKWRENRDGTVDLLKPKFYNKKLQQFFSRWMKQPHYTVHLDEIGSSVWKLIDGRRSMESIAQALQSKFAERIEPVYDRLEKFIDQLHRAKFILIKNLS